MDYPVYINGTVRGNLSVTNEGLYTRFRANCDMISEMVRLTVFGGGKSAYLGVLYPENGRLVLNRRLTKNDLSRFPTVIEYAADREKEPDPAFPREKSSEPATDDTLLWFQSPGGTISAFDGSRMLVAIPADREKIGGKGRIRHINGRDYLVFYR